MVGMCVGFDFVVKSHLYQDLYTFNKLGIKKNSKNGHTSGLVRQCVQDA